VLALLLLGACGDDGGDIAEDTTTTTAEETTTTEAEDEDEESEDEESNADDEEREEGDGEEFDPGDGETMEGGAISQGGETLSECLEEDQSIDFDIVLPEGGTLTVTPTDGGDMVVETSSDIFDDGLSGDEEVLEATSEVDETVSVYEYWGYAACFELTVDS
jgi:hypothetical protein